MLFQEPTEQERKLLKEMKSWAETAKAHLDAKAILHVKCAVSDGRTLFLTSANLTKFAFNMELGLLVTGGGLPELIEQHFTRMIQMRPAGKAIILAKRKQHSRLLAAPDTEHGLKLLDAESRHAADR